MIAPLWADVLTACFVIIGSLAALIGSFGVLRLPGTFLSLHALTLGATVGTWGFAFATVVQISFAREELFLHTLLIPAFVALTAPITTVFLARAVLFRSRSLGPPHP